MSLTLSFRARDPSHISICFLLAEPSLLFEQSHRVSLNLRIPIVYDGGTKGVR
jgi:hypothetical protein